MLWFFNHQKLSLKLKKIKKILSNLHYCLLFMFSHFTCEAMRLFTLIFSVKQRVAMAVAHSPLDKRPAGYLFSHLFSLSIQTVLSSATKPYGLNLASIAPDIFVVVDAAAAAAAVGGDDVVAVCLSRHFFRLDFVVCATIYFSSSFQSLIQFWIGLNALFKVTFTACTQRNTILPSKQIIWSRNSWCAAKMR